MANGTNDAHTPGERMAAAQKALLDGAAQFAGALAGLVEAAAQARPPVEPDVRAALARNSAESLAAIAFQRARERDAARAEAEELRRRPSEAGAAQAVKAREDEFGGRTFDIHTDGQGRTYHLLVREGGSISFYYTVGAGGYHAVLWDSLDDDSMTPAPDWSQAPAWATAHAYLHNGLAAWFERAPEPMHGGGAPGWDAKGGRVVAYEPERYLSWWRGTVRRRPQEDTPG